MSNLVYSRAADLMEAELHNELVALDPVGGHCFGFNEVAAAVWKLLEQPKSIDQLSAALTEEFDVADEQCRADLRELMDEMICLGLVRKL